MARRPYISPVRIGRRLACDRPRGASRLIAVCEPGLTSTTVLSRVVGSSPGDGKAKERSESGRGVELGIQLDLGV